MIRQIHLSQFMINLGILRAWFEKLRKTSVVELKSDLEVSGDFIGFVSFIYYSLQAQTFVRRQQSIHS